MRRFEARFLAQLVQAPSGANVAFQCRGRPESHLGSATQATKEGSQDFPDKSWMQAKGGILTLTMAKLSAVRILVLPGLANLRNLHMLDHSSQLQGLLTKAAVYLPEGFLIDDSQDMGRM